MQTLIISIDGKSEHVTDYDMRPSPDGERTILYYDDHSICGGLLTEMTKAAAQMATQMVNFSLFGPFALFMAHDRSPFYRTGSYELPFPPRTFENYLWYCQLCDENPVLTIDRLPAIARSFAVLPATRHDLIESTDPHMMAAYVVVAVEIGKKQPEIPARRLRARGLRFD